MSVCKSCRAEIEWLTNDGGNRVPMQRVSTLFRRTGNIVEVSNALGAGPFWISHFQTCPDAAAHSKRAKRGSR